jgi:RHS repeat-associated protein
MNKHLLAAVLISLALWPELAIAKFIGPDPPQGCPSCGCNCTGAPSRTVAAPTSTGISATEGNLTETIPVSTIHSTLSLSFVYNSYNADTSRAIVDTVMGYGWTHSYNIFLFTQAGLTFRYDGEGRVTRYGLGPGGTYVAATGYFETLGASGGGFTVTQKDKTTYHFALIPGTPFLVSGSVYRLTSIGDRNGNTTTLTYSSGNLTQVTDTYGRAITFTYTAQNKLASVTDPLGRVTTLQYDSTGHKLTKITDPNNNSIQYSYNTFYQLTGKTDKAGRTFTYSYSSGFPGLPIAVKDGAGGTSATLSNPSSWSTNPTQLALYLKRVYTPSTTTDTDGRGNTWKYQYDSNGYLTQFIAPDGATTTYTYDPATLQLATMTDPNGNTTSNIYDSEGNRLHTTDALGHVTAYTYEPVFNMMTRMTDPRGRVTTYTYDTRGNRVQETDPLGKGRHWAYDSHGNVTQYTDKDGNVTQHTYDSFGNLIQETEAVGTSIQSMTQYTFDAVGNRISMIDALGRVTQYQYDGMNRLIRETDAVGTPQKRTIQTFYDGEGNRTEVIDGRGTVTQYQFDLRQRLVTETDAVGTLQQRMITTTYDTNDNRTTVTDPLGRVTKFQYDTRNRIVQETDAAGTINATMQTSYDPVSNITSRTDANGHTTGYTYDQLNRRTTMTDAVGDKTLFFYDTGTFAGPVTLGGVTVMCNQCGATPGSNLVTEQVDPDGTASLHAGTTYNKYDALDRLVITDRRTGCIGGPMGTGCSDTINTSTDAVTLQVYDPEGNRLTWTEPDGNTTDYKFDAKNRLIQQTNAAGDVTLTTYDLVNNVATVTAPNLNVTTNTYDALNRMIEVTDSDGLVETDSYDADNNRVSHGDGNGNITNSTYDPLNRMVSSTDPLGKITSNQYDSVGNFLSITDRIGNITAYTYDNLNRRSTLADALGNITKWQYDLVGNLVKLTDANLNSTQYSYDAVNRPLCERYADSTMRCYTYDSAGNLTQRQDAISGQTVTYSYTDLYFLQQRMYAPSGANDTFTYDLSGRMLTNQRTNSTFTWPESFTYDGANRLNQSVQDGQTINYSYSIPSRVRTITYPGGRVITEHTDFRARMDQIDDATSPPSIVQYTYDLADNMLDRNYRNGTASTYTYNANNWMSNLQHANGGVPLATFSYAYDSEGNKQYELKSPNTSQSECYGYDTTYRLISYQSGTPGSPTNPCPVVAPPTPPTQTSYSLDPVGNWSSKTTNGVNQTRSHNSVNEVTTIDAQTLSYDNDGDLRKDGTYSYQYDEEHRLVNVTPVGASVPAGQYQYDALSRRVQKIANPTGSLSTTTLYFYNDARIIEEQNTGGATQATYVYGNYVDEILTMDRGGQTYYYHQNQLWSVEAITNSSGNPVERYDYCGGKTLQCGDPYGSVSITDGSFNPIAPNAWGTPHSAIGNPWTFTGRQFEEETGLYYYRARHYDAGKGRFLQRDPVETEPVCNSPAGSADPGACPSYPTANLYEYANDNPINRVDPTGNVDYSKPKKIQDNARPFGPWGPNGSNYEVKTDAGNRIIVWKPANGTTYWCHGLTFGGKTAAGGPFSPYSGAPVQRILADEWQEWRCCDAEPGDIAVWNPTTRADHSATFTKVNLRANGQAINEATSTLRSKNGGFAAEGIFTLRSLMATYGNIYKCYTKKHR